MNDDRQAVRVGAGVLVALLAAVVLILALEGKHLRAGVRLSVEMERVGDLQVGAKVRLAGLVLGDVENIRLVGKPSRARVDLWIDRRHAWLLTTTTDFFLSQEGLLGEPFVGVAGRPGEPGPALAPGATVRGIDPPRIDQLLATIDKNLRSIAVLRDELPERQLLEDELDKLGANLDTFDASAPIAAVTRLAGEASGLGGGVRPGTLGRIADLASALRPPPLAGRLAALGDRLSRLDGFAGPRVARFVAALDGAGAIVARAEQALEGAAAIRAMLESGRGTLGAFLRDVEIADEMKEMMRTMKRQPWVTIGKPEK